MLQYVTVAQLAAALLLCSSDSFMFPPLPRVELRAITATPMTHFTGYDGWQPEVLRIHPRGVNICNLLYTYVVEGR